MDMTELVQQAYERARTTYDKQFHTWFHEDVDPGWMWDLRNSEWAKAVLQISSSYGVTVAPLLVTTMFAMEYTDEDISEHLVNVIASNLERTMGRTIRSEEEGWRLTKAVIQVGLGSGIDICNEAVQGEGDEDE